MTIGKLAAPKPPRGGPRRGGGKPARHRDQREEPASNQADYHVQQPSHLGAGQGTHTGYRHHSLLRRE